MAARHFPLVSIAWIYGALSRGRGRYGARSCPVVVEDSAAPGVFWWWVEDGVAPGVVRWWVEDGVAPGVVRWWVEDSAAPGVFWWWVEDGVAPGVVRWWVEDSVVPGLVRWWVEVVCGANRVFLGLIIGGPEEWVTQIWREIQSSTKHGETINPRFRAFRGFPVISPFRYRVLPGLKLPLSV
ncbi:unnamed protein product [Arctogadus glacialis]